MPQIISIGLALLLGFKDMFSQKNGKTNDTLKNVIVGVVVYFLVNRFLNNQAKTDLLANSANDPNATFAIRLHDALNPTGIDWLNNLFGDGTDETAVKEISLSMSVSKCFVSVSQSYKTIYGTDLTEDLRKDGVFDLFQTNYATGGGATGGGVAVNPYIKAGSTVKAKNSNYWLRDTTNTTKTLRKTVAGELFTVVGVYNNKNIGGTLGSWIKVSQTAYFGVIPVPFTTNEYFVFIDGLLKVV